MTNRRVSKRYLFRNHYRALYLNRLRKQSGDFEILLRIVTPSSVGCANRPKWFKLNIQHKFCDKQARQSCSCKQTFLLLVYFWMNNFHLQALRVDKLFNYRRSLEPYWLTLVIPWGDETFCSLPDRPWGPSSLLHNEPFPEGKAAGVWCRPPSPKLALMLTKE